MLSLVLKFKGFYMNHLSLFLNNRVIGNNELRYNGCGDLFARLGNWCLKPVRCLFNGNVVKVYQDYSDPKITKVYHMKEYGRETFDSENRTLVKVIKAIVLLVPGILFGSAIKGLTYFSKSIREKHNFVIKHYTPKDRVIGSENERLDIKEIISKLKKEHENNHLNQKTETITIYAQPGTQLTTELGIMDFNPKKIIFVGAKLANVEKYWQGRLNSNWETMLETKPKKYKSQNGLQVDNSAFVMKGNLARLLRTKEDVKDKLFITQWKADSLAKALSDTPPRKSIFSFKRYTRIYYIES